MPHELATHAPNELVAPRLFLSQPYYTLRAHAEPSIGVIRYDILGLRAVLLKLRMYSCGNHIPLNCTRGALCPLLDYIAEAGNQELSRILPRGPCSL